MKIDITVLPEYKKMNNDILASFLPEIRQDFRRGVSRLRAALPKTVNHIITSSPEYAALLGGELRLELGIPDAGRSIAGLIDIWSSNIQHNYTEPRIVRNSIVATFSASLFKIDFSDVLYTDYAKVYDTSRGYELPWLQWLLLEGNAPIISDHNVVFGPSRYSRTGGALMKKGKSWSVPSSYAGTISDNWITRSIQANQTIIEALLSKVFK